MAIQSLRQFCGNLFEGFVYSQELTLNEIKDFSDKSGYIFAEGEICIMTFAHCPVQVNYKCNCDTCKYKGDIFYTDKTNRKFALKRKKVYNCYWEMYNCLPLSGGKKLFKNLKLKVTLRSHIVKRIRNSIQTMFGILLN